MKARQAVRRDVAAINELALEAHAFHVKGVPGVFRMPTSGPANLRYWASALKGRNTAVLVAEDDGRLAGYVQVGIRDAMRLPVLKRRRFGYVSNLGVGRRWRRRGVGRLLMQAAHQWLRQRHIREIELNVWSFNRGALRFYERLGYRFLSHRMGKGLAR
ncbi:MAG: GNAT family N-acetyltransferase [Candidatus Coatesbacteria bacterium]